MGNNSRRCVSRNIQPAVEALENRRLLSVTYLSDLDPVSAVSPYGGYKKDLATNGTTLDINGQVWAKGLGTHAASELVYNLNGEYNRFESYVGIDDFVGDGPGDGSAVFQVWGDGQLLASSSRLTGADKAEFISVDITGVNQLRLVTTTGGDNDYKDHTNWAGAWVYTNDEHVPTHLTLEVIQPIATDSQDAIVRVNRIGRTGTTVLLRVNAGTVFSAFLNSDEPYVDIPIPAYLIGSSDGITVSLAPSNDYILDSDPVKVFYQPDTVLPTLSLEVIDPTTTSAKSAVVRVTRTSGPDDMLAVRVNAGTIFTVFLNEGASFVDVPIPVHLFGALDELEVSLADSPSYVFDGNPVTVYYDRSATSDVVYLSDMEASSVISPYFGLQKDKAANGNPLTINGQTWQKGLGTHSTSEVIYNLNGEYSRFQAYVGIDDFVGNGASDGSAVFQVWGDGQLLASSSRLTGADGAEFLDVDVTGVNQLRLVTTTGGDSDYKDHTDWADAKLLKVSDTIERPHLSLEVIEPTATDTQDAIVRITRTGSTSGSLMVRIAAGTPFSVFIDPGNSYVDVPIPKMLFGPSGVLTVSIIEDSAAYIIDGDPVTVYYQADSGSSEAIYLSDLTPVSATSPYFGLQKDKAANGTPLEINGQTWAKGLGTHAASQVVYDLNGQYKRFEAYVGIDDFVGDGPGDGSAIFQVWGDGVLLASSSRLTGADDAEFLSVDIEGVDELVLITTTGGDSDYKDHTNWADAKLFSDVVIT